jgi:hypothetical protein
MAQKNALIIVLGYPCHPTGENSVLKEGRKEELESPYKAAKAARPVLEGKLSVHD